MGDRVSIKPKTVKKYLQIYQLPENVKCLLRPFKIRTYQEQQMLFNYPHLKKSYTLRIDAAWSISRYLSEFSDEIKTEIAYFFLGKNVKDCEKIALMKSTEQSKDLQTIYDLIVEEKRGKKGYRKVEFYLSLEHKTELNDWCIRKQKNYRDLLREIVTEWLSNQ